jgi:hypothetical protein
LLIAEIVASFFLLLPSAITANSEMDEVVFVDRRSLPSHNK